MRFLLSWIRDYVRLAPDGPEAARLLTEHAFETSVLPPLLRPSLKRMVVGEVLAVDRHPQADRLSLVTVRLSRKSVRVVCGAPNVRAGQFVVVALPGAQFVDGNGELCTLKRASIRGVASAGMICSERELGLGAAHDGILELPAGEVKSGQPVSRLFPPETVLEADILPNRAADASSHIGVARELGAILRLAPKLPRLLLKKVPSRLSLPVTVADPAHCPRYVLLELDRIRPGPSPLWLQSRLRALGIRPVNLIVDVTNYVLWDTGQPTHAFDVRALGSSLGVRAVRAKTGETITTLDGVTRVLPPGALVIVSDDRPVAAAGIMGGADTAVREDTSHIILEAAVFAAAQTRGTSQRLELTTDASERFSRGVTSAHVDAGIARALELLVKFGGARVLSFKDVAAKSPPRATIVLRHDHLEDVLGLRVPPAAVKTTLHALDCRVSATASAYRVRPSPFRTDLHLPEDLVEEVGRILGYARLPAPLPDAPIVPAVLPPELQDVRGVQDAMRGAGWLEAYTYSFMREEETRALKLHLLKHLGVVNPPREDLRRLRLSLLPNLLALAVPVVKKDPVGKIFELGSVYPVKGPAVTHLAGVLVRRSETRADDFYETKGVAEHVLDQLGVPDVWFDPTEPTPQESFLASWEEGSAAEIKSGETELGFVGAIARSVLDEARIRGSVTAFELNLSRVFELEKVQRVYQPPFPYPLIQRDLSLRVPEDVLVDEITEAVGAAGGILVQDVDFLDMYESSDGAERTVTLRISYGSRERTLRDEEANTAHRTIIRAVEEKLGVRERR